MFFFDAEDYTSERPQTAIRDLCNLFHEDGMTVHVAMVGYFAQEIARRGRQDVVAALKPRPVGPQSMYHSVHPNVLEAVSGNLGDSFHEDKRCYGYPVGSF